MGFFIGKADTKPPKPKTKVKGAYKAKRLDALARRMQRSVALDLAKGIQTFKKRVKRSAIQSAWESGSYESVDQYIPWRSLEGDLAPAKRRLQSSLLGAADLSIKLLPAPMDSLRWDLENPAIREYVDKKVGNLVREITDETRGHIREAAARSFRVASTPREVASEIVSSIGLHKRYRDALRNYKTWVLYESGQKNIRNQQLMIERYEDRLLKARAMTIARTETRRATNHGQRSVWREAGRQGLIPKSSKRIWVIDGDPCEICEPLDGEEADLDGSYPGGLEPGDAHPNCQCIEVLELE